jgi:hemerythrin-like metal-binding protein
MSKLAWNKPLAIGITLIDDQHQTLYELLRQLDDRVQSQAGPRILGDALDRLVWHTAMHFADEEALMKSHGYPAATAHTAEHYRLIKVVITLQKRLAAHADDLTSGDMVFLRDWLEHHILGADIPLGEYLQDHGVVQAAAPALARQHRTSTGDAVTHYPARGRTPQ